VGAFLALLKTPTPDIGQRPQKLPKTKPMVASAAVKAIYRYPVKGLPPQALPRVAVEPHQTLPADRLYAIENGPSGFDPAAPAYLPKQRFLMLMRNERLAALRTDYDEPSHTLVVQLGGHDAISGDLRTPQGRAAIERFFATYCADELRGPPRILSGAGHSFSDVAKKVVSIINLASVAAVESAIGAPVNPLRFRANIYAEGWPAWHEVDLLGRDLTLGTMRVKVVKQIVRCAATEVDPDTGIRDLEVPRTLMRAFGHTNCGVYAEVRAGGEVALGDSIAEL
jgi:uncharacterized protein YcbX